MGRSWLVWLRRWPVREDVNAQKKRSVYALKTE